MSLFASASSPVARNHWGKFELIIRERGDEGSSFPSLPARTLRSFPSSLSCASRLSRVLTSSPIPTYTWESQWRRQYLLGKYRIGFVTISLKNNILKYSHRGSRDVWLLHTWIPLLNPHPLELLAWLWVLITNIWISCNDVTKSVNSSIKSNNILDHKWLAICTKLLKPLCKDLLAD